MATYPLTLTFGGQSVSAPGVLTTQAAGQKALLQSSDLTFVGAFLLPTTFGGENLVGNRGLAIRTVGGTVKFLTLSLSLFEGDVPTTLSTIPSSFPQATLTRNYGNLFTVARNAIPTAVAAGPYGIYWDEPG